MLLFIATRCGLRHSMRNNPHANHLCSQSEGHKGESLSHTNPVDLRQGYLNSIQLAKRHTLPVWVLMVVKVRYDIVAVHNLLRWTTANEDGETRNAGTDVPADATQMEQRLS